MRVYICEAVREEVGYNSRKKGNKRSPPKKQFFSSKIFNVVVFVARCLAAGWILKSSPTFIYLSSQIREK